MNAQWDAVVIGAGPAGSTAARALATRGARVLLLDRRAFPRDKPCAGGVSAEVFPALPGPPPSHVPAVPLDGVEMRWGRRWDTCIDAPGAGCVVRRAEFDAWLLDEATKAGAQFRPAALPRALERTGDGIRLRLGSDQVTARRLIGCDGAFSWTARRIGVRPRSMAWALEAVLPGLDVTRPLIDFSFGRRGYGWIFPRPGGASAGVCSVERRGIRPLFERFLAASGVRPSPEPPRLWPVPLGTTAVDGWSGRVLLAGDAAGAVHPCLGEGIRYAVLTGRAAAEAVAAETDYAAWFRGEMAPEFRAAARIRTLFYASPPAVAGWFLHLPRVRRGLTDIFYGRLTCRECTAAWRRFPALVRTRPA